MAGAGDRPTWKQRLSDALGLVLAIAVAVLAVAPVLATRGTYGVHDWDQMFSHRYLAVKTIKAYHQFPFWDPYTCGGHTWWGGLESGTNLVSPWLLAYLLTSLPTAMRIEVVGTTVLGAIGAWAFAGRYTRSPALRLLVTTAFAINGRWALQASVGHTWHLYYAWVPWVLFFLDRAVGAEARSRTELRDVILLGVSLAMMVYSGAIYPLPQTVIVVGLYAVVCAVRSRSARPVGIALAGGLLSFAFSAPKLLPVLDMLRRYPRLIESTETMDLGGFVGVFTAAESDPHPAVGPWGWHEFGIYVGWIPFLAMLAGLFLARTTRERALAAAGWACLVLSFGRFHEYAPWAVFHDHLPIFKSQHVPSRWHHPAVLVLTVVTVAAIERRMPRARRWLVELPLMAIAIWVAKDVALESQKPLGGALTRPPPIVAESTGTFHTEISAPDSLRYADTDWAPPTLPAMMANVGLIDCSAFPGLNVYLKDSSGRVPDMGAHGKSDPAYRGEVYFAQGTGYAAIETFSPNRVVVHYDGAKPGDRLVINQNWDPGWSTDAGPVQDYAHLTSVAVHEPSGEVVFKYRPRYFVTGVMILVLTIVGLVLGGDRRFRRWLLSRTPPAPPPEQPAPPPDPT